MPSPWPLAHTLLPLKNAAIRYLGLLLTGLLLLSACMLQLPESDSALPGSLRPVAPELSNGKFASSTNALVPTTAETISITVPGEYITDALFDPVADQIYVSDSQGQVTVLDGSTYAPLQIIDAWGYLWLEADERRLYISTDEFPLPLEVEPMVTILALGQNKGETPTILGSLPGASISVDSIHSRLYVGQPLDFGQISTDSPGIRIYDLETLAQIGQSSHGGRPVYNPIADNLLIVAYTVLIADAESGYVTGQLPIVPTDEESLMWCNGCTWATAAYVLPDHNKIGVVAHPRAMRSYVSSPLASFDATSMEPLSGSILREEYDPDCGNPLTLRAPIQIGEKSFHHAFDANYITNNYLEIYEAGGSDPVRRIAGIAPAFVNPRTAQLTTVDGLLLNLADLTPITTVEPLCVFETLPTDDLLARELSPWQDGHLLRIVRSVKSRPKPPKPIASSGLLGYELAQIIPSPTFGASDSRADLTLFVRTEYDNGLFRSQDGGRTWELLDIGLPWELFEGMSIQLSPDFAHDQTLFVAGPNVHHRGLGVWRSTDGGDTWYARWQGLDDLRIASMLISLDFSTDQTLVVQTIEGQIYRTDDAGNEWVFLPNVELEGGFDNLAQFLKDKPDLPSANDGDQGNSAPYVRIDFMTGELVYQTMAERQNNSDEWTVVPIDLPMFANGSPQYWTQVIATPSDPWTYYAISDRTIWRTLDGGINWLPIVSTELEKLAEGAHLRTATIVGDPYLGGTILLVGTSNGEVWRIDE